MPATDYDRVAYPTMAHPQTFAEGLAIKGWLRGLDVAPPATARVLELGVGDGFNLAMMAVNHPGGRYVGLDYADEAITRGRDFCAQLGLHQVELRTVDIRALPDDLGTFDYIIAHGVYSWVPPDVREALLAALGRLLAPEGVAFVSYLALPGAYLREMVRVMMRFHTRDTPDPMAQCSQARALLHLLAHATEVPNLFTEWLKNEETLIAAHSDSTLFHDELSVVSAPLLFTDFIAAADPHGLRFLCEAEYLAPVGRSLTAAAREQLQPLTENRLLLEQYLDFVEGRRFRQTLLCRPGRGAELVPARLDALHVSFAARAAGEVPGLAAEAPAEYRGPKNAELRARTVAEKALLAELSARPGFVPVPEALAGARARVVAAGLTPPPDFDAAVRTFLLRSYVPGLVELAWQRPPWTDTPPRRPLAHPLGRWLLARGAPSAVTYAGTFLEIEGAMGRLLVSLLDGTRDAPAVLAAVQEWLRGQHAAAQAAGQPAPALPSPDDPALLPQLARSLTGLCQMRLIAAPPPAPAT